MLLLQFKNKKSISKIKNWSQTVFKSFLRGLEFETVFYTTQTLNSQPGSNMTETEVFWSEFQTEF